MTSFESIPTEETPVSPENIDLGTERIDDPEKAFLMAKFENASHDKATAYEEYLNSPESRSDSTSKEALSFVIWKSLGYSPDDIIDIGQCTSEVMGKNYDVEKKVQKFEQEGNKLGLFVESMKSLFSITSEFLSAGAGGVKSLFSKEKNKKGLLSKNFYKHIERINGGILRGDTIREAVQKLNEGGRTEITEESLWKSADEAIEDASVFVNDDSSTSDEVVAKEGNEPSENSEDNKSDSDEVVDTREPEHANISKLFADVVATKYEKYLKEEKEKRKKNSYFDSLEAKGVKPDDVRKECSKTDIWIKNLGGYADKLKKMSDGEVKSESGANFIASILELANQKTPDTGKILRNGSGLLYKIYQATLEERRRDLRS